MITKRRGLIAGGLLAGAILVGTAGLAAAQDPSPSPSPTGPGAGMMGGQNGSGMMGGQNGARMMGGQDGSGMMGGQGEAGMMGAGMGSGKWTPEQLQAMSDLHDKMIASGTCDPAAMQALHDQLNGTN